MISGAQTWWVEDKVFAAEHGRAPRDLAEYIAVAGAVCQNLWAGTIYPLLERSGWLAGVTRALERASAPFEPYILWRVTPTKFPINSQELAFMSMLLSILLYVGISLLSRRAPFNMDRLLHRGKYHREGIRAERPRLTLRTLIPTLVGIDNQYTRGDKVLAWSVFFWSLGWGFLCCFVTVALWNFVRPWSNGMWANWFFFQQFIVAGAVAVVSTVWFTWGGTRDLIRLFRDLAARETDIRDDGRVEGHVSADDLALVAQAEHGAVAAAQPAATLPEPPDIEGLM